jgi:hypothetical protein
MQQSLGGGNEEKRVDFSGLFLWCLEHFHLNNYVNKQNMHIWGTKNLHEISKTLLHFQNCMV